MEVNERALLRTLYTWARSAESWKRGVRSTSHRWVLYRVGPGRHIGKSIPDQSKQPRGRRKRPGPQGAGRWWRRRGGQEREVVGPSPLSHCERYHLAFDGLLLPSDDHFWSIAAPPNGWKCSCTCRFVSRVTFKRYQREGIAYPAVGDTPPNLGKPINTNSPKLRPKQFHNKITGQKLDGFEEIEPGFECNPAEGNQLGRSFSIANMMTKDVKDTMAVVRDEGKPFDRWAGEMLTNLRPSWMKHHMWDQWVSSVDAWEPL